ncbi:MAG: hypothetical protein RIC12_00640 [Pirellulales bacterium]
MSVTVFRNRPTRHRQTSSTRPDRRTDKDSIFPIIEQLSRQSQTGDKVWHGKGDAGQATGAKHATSVDLVGWQAHKAKRVIDSTEEENTDGLLIARPSATAFATGPLKLATPILTSAFEKTKEWHGQKCNPRM